VHWIFGAIFESARPEEELSRLEARAAAPDFWKDQADAQKVLQRRRRLEQDRDLVLSLKKRSEDLAVLVEWADAGEAVDTELHQALDLLDQEVQAGEIKKMLGGEHDRRNAIVTIHPGAGGTESQDWAEMLLRMYLRWTLSTWR
jgi:peptide chain release factor 2